MYINAVCMVTITLYRVSFDGNFQMGGEFAKISNAKAIRMQETFANISCFRNIPLPNIFSATVIVVDENYRIYIRHIVYMDTFANTS